MPLEAAQRLVDVAQAFLGALDQIGLGFSIGAQAGNIHFVALLQDRIALVATEIADALVGLVAQTGEHFAQHFLPAIFRHLSFGTHNRPAFGFLGRHLHLCSPVAGR